MPLHENGARVARPHAVGRPLVEVHAGQIHPGTLQHAARPLLRVCVLDQDVDLLHCGKLAHDLRVNPGNGLEAARPVGGIVRPCDPGCAVRLPLGRHAVAQRLRRCVLRHFTATFELSGGSRKRLVMPP